MNSSDGSIINSNYWKTFYIIENVDISWEREFVRKNRSIRHWNDPDIHLPFQTRTWVVRGWLRFWLVVSFKAIRKKWMSIQIRISLWKITVTRSDIEPASKTNQYLNKFYFRGGYISSILVIALLLKIKGSHPGYKTASKCLHALKRVWIVERNNSGHLSSPAVLWIVIVYDRKPRWKN